MVGSNLCVVLFEESTGSHYLSNQYTMDRDYSVGSSDNAVLSATHMTLNKSEASRLIT